MASEVNMKCWLCPETFGKPIELKNHAIDKHDVCRLICPWCLDKKETFKRISELAKHSKRKHPDLVEELKEMDFFSETNGFWLAVRPQDYARAVKPSDWPNITAIRTRAALIGWMEKRGGNEKAREELEKGWNLALGIKPVHQTPNNRKRKLPQYSPDKPEISTELGIVSISLTSSRKVAYLKMDETSSQLWYEVELQQWVVEDKKAMENLLRRMAVIKDDSTPPKEFGTRLKLKDVSFTLQRITSVLGIGERHVKGVSREIQKVERISVKELEKTTAEMMDIGEDPEYEIMDSLDDEEVQKDNNGRIVVSKEAEVEHQEAGSQAEGIKEKAQVVPQIEEVPAEVVSQEATSGEKQPDTGNDEHKKDVQEVDEPEVSTVENKEPSEIEVNHKPDQPVVINKDLDTEQEDHQPDKQKAADETQSQEAKELDHQMRAEQLLKVGGMPLFPPGRRQWEEWQIVISRTPTTMYWPPKDWTKLTPGEKLTAWRFAAFSLEREQGGNILIHERDVLDKYAMLALPGTKIEKVADESHMITTRLANYNLLCKIYRGQIVGAEAEGWLTMLERAVGDEWKNSKLHQIMDDIPLRLTKTTQD